MTTRTATNFWIDVVSLVVMVGLAATGGLIHYVLPAGSGHFYELYGWNRHDIGQVHFYLAVVAVGLLALHVLLHWGWVCCVVGNAVGRAHLSKRAQTGWGLVLLLGIAIFLVGGLGWSSSRVQKTAKVHVPHREECPAGASVDGRTSLKEAASVCGVSVAQLAMQLRLPVNIDPQVTLGRLKRHYGLELQAVRKIACSPGSLGSHQLDE
jgi:hypothetical protein